MVRKALRSYTAIEAAFQALDVKEQHVRRRFEPITDEEKEAWALGAANRLTAIKHRYADALDWKDDSSTLRTVDVPPGERREKARRLRSACPPSERGASRPAAKPLILQKGTRDQDLKGRIGHVVAHTQPHSFGEAPSSLQRLSPPRTGHTTDTHTVGSLRINDLRCSRESVISRQPSPRDAATSRPVSARSSRHTSPDRHRPASASLAASVRGRVRGQTGEALGSGSSAVDTQDDMGGPPGGANATALTAAVRQAAAYVAQRPAVAAAAADSDAHAAPSALLLRRHASAHCLSVVTATAVGQQIVTPISKRPKARTDLHTDDVNDDTNTTAHTAGASPGAHSSHTVTHTADPHKRGSGYEHTTLVRFQTHEAAVALGIPDTASGLLPPMPKTHPYMLAGAAVLPPSEENGLILAALQQQQQGERGEATGSGKASPAALTPQARLMYLGHARPRSAGPQQQQRQRRTRSASPRRRSGGSDGCGVSRPGSAGRDHSPVTRGGPAYTSPPSDIRLHNAGASLAVQQWEQADGVGNTGAAHSRPPVPTRVLAGKPPLARPQSARPASATHTYTYTATVRHAAGVPQRDAAQAHTGQEQPHQPQQLGSSSTSHAATQAHMTSVVSPAQSVRLTHRGVLSSDPVHTTGYNDNNDNTSCYTGKAVARRRPWSAAAAVACSAAQPDTQHTAAAAMHSGAGGGWDGQLGNSVGISCPAEQYVLPQRHPQAHLVGMTAKGQRQLRRAAAWAATAPLRPSSAPLPSYKHITARVDTGQSHRLLNSYGDESCRDDASSVRASSAHTSTQRVRVSSTADRSHAPPSHSLILTSPEEAYAQFASEQARRELGIIEDNEPEECDPTPSHSFSHTLTHSRPHSSSTSRAPPPLSLPPTHTRHTPTPKQQQNLRYGASTALSRQSSGGGTSVGGGQSVAGGQRDNTGASSHANWSVGEEGVRASVSFAWDAMTHTHTGTRQGGGSSDGASTGVVAGGQGQQSLQSPQSQRAGALRAARAAAWQRVAGAAGLSAAETDALAAAATASRPGTPGSPGAGAPVTILTHSALNTLSAATATATHTATQSPLRASRASVSVSEMTHMTRNRQSVSVGDSLGDGLVGAIAREVAARNPHSKKEEGLGSVQLLSDARRYGPSTAPVPRHHPATQQVAAWLDFELSTTEPSTPTSPHMANPYARTYTRTRSTLGEPSPTAAAAAAAAAPAWAKRGVHADAGSAVPPTPSRSMAGGHLRWKDEEEGGVDTHDAHMLTSPGGPLANRTGGILSKAGSGDVGGGGECVNTVGMRVSDNGGGQQAVADRAARWRSPGSAASSMRGRSTIASDDPALYQLTAQVQTNGLRPAPTSLAGWRFNLYITDLGRHGSTRGVRYCVARHTVCDSRHRLVLPCHGDAPSYEEPREEYKVHMTGRCTATLSLSHLLPWVRRPHDLYLHWVRVEAYAVVPVAAKVLDACVFLCGPEDDVPGAAPDVSSMSVKELADGPSKKEWKR